MPAYAATKAALDNLTVSLANEVARTGIIATPGVERFYRQIAPARGWGSDWAQIEQGVLRDVFDNPTGRLGLVADIAALVAFVASPLGGFINGANLRIDGGSTSSVN
jgi:NAD(P)-dependent dehydrogenase (short-subunit alcohol dehydrogenase family)